MLFTFLAVREIEQPNLAFHNNNYYKETLLSGATEVTDIEGLEQWIRSSFISNFAAVKGDNSGLHQQAIKDTTYLPEDTLWRDTLFLGQTCIISHRAKEVECPRVAGHTCYKPYLTPQDYLKEDLLPQTSPLYSIGKF